MLKLKELQRWVQARIISKIESSDPADLTIESSRFSREERWDVYRQGYVIRARETLEEDFEVTFEFLGGKAGDLVISYTETFPSTEKSLVEFGRNFPRFLASRGIPAEIVELAKIEWELTELEYSDAKPLSQKGLELLSKGGSGLRLQLGRNVRLMVSPFPLVEMYSNRETLPPRHIYLVASKKPVGVEFEEVSETEFRALQSIRAGASLEEVIRIFLLSGSPELMNERMRAWMENCWIDDAVQFE